MVLLLTVDVAGETEPRHSLTHSGLNQYLSAILTCIKIESWFLHHVCVDSIQTHYPETKKWGISWI